jgi:predicted PurR-regulated permease PerM
VHFALVFAVLAGLLKVIPIIGAFIAGAIIVGFALSQSLQMALITLAFFVALQQLEGNVLTPMVMRSQTNIHLFLILVALVLGSGAGDLVGVLFAIPLAGAVKVLVVEVLDPAVRRADLAQPRR